MTIWNYSGIIKGRKWYWTVVQSWGSTAVDSIGKERVKGIVDFCNGLHSWQSEWIILVLNLIEEVNSDQGDHESDGAKRKCLPVSFLTWQILQQWHVNLDLGYGSNLNYMVAPCRDLPYLPGNNQ